jgi:polyhydroxyalkanoate synthesis regulator phasin
MSISAKRKLAVGAAGLAVLAGSGGAYAAAAGTPQTAPKPAADRAAEQKAFLDDVAKRLNVTRDQLDAAVKGAAEARIDAAVKDGKLTQEQGEAAKKRLANGIPLLSGPALGIKPHGPGGPGFGERRGFGFGFGFDGAADYLGLTEAQLKEQLQDGKSLAEVAKAQNKDVAGLKTALKANVTKKLDEAVKDGHMTDAQKTRILADVDDRLDDVINGTPPRRPDGPKFRWR